MTSITRSPNRTLISLRGWLADTRQRAIDESEKGETVEKAIIVAAAAAIAIAAMAAIALAIATKVGGLKL